MQDVTNLPFMRVIERYGGPDHYVTEYFRVHADSTLEKKILRSITENETGRPIYAQLIGQDINALVRTSIELLEYPIAGIDLNLGCPAPVVCRKDAGGGLLRKTKHMEAIIAAMRETIPSGKFTIKTRLGYQNHDEFPRLLEIFNRYALDGFTLHARTVRERYQTPIHADCIRLAVETLHCPVTANGNAVDTQTALGILRRTGAAGLMIGRGAIRNPWIFSQIRATLTGETPHVVTRADLLGYIFSLYQEIGKHTHDFDETKHVHRMKKYLVYIVQGLDEEFEHRIRRVRCEKDFYDTCRGFLDNTEPVPALPPENSRLFCGFEPLLHY